MRIVTMDTKTILLALTMLFTIGQAKAADDYKQSSEYLTLRDSMHHAFNDADSARFFPAVTQLEDYLLQQGDLHAYYTQRCNEIVFQLNRQNIYEAYVLARNLSMELREKKLEKEMYMAYNMLGHLNRYCGNKEAAKRNFNYVISEMEKYGYYESMPPIYLNLVNVELDDDPDEARQLLERALEIARKYSPERVFDIETRKTLSYFNSGNIDKFLEGYKEYRKGVEEGLSSVHGRTLEVYYLACMGKTDEAVALAKKELGEDSGDAITKVYEMAGRWKDAFESLRQETAAKDSINNVVLINSMAGVREQLTLHDVERKTARNRSIAFTIGILLLALLVAALSYIILARRRHMRQLKRAYDHALESDKMKSAFIRNITHEVRTPLNIISGFAQVFADPNGTFSPEERRDMADMIQKNTDAITSLIDEMLEMSLSDSTTAVAKEDNVCVNELLREVRDAERKDLNGQTQLFIESSLAEDYIMQTNRVMMKRILTSLVNNAVKYTEQGVIRIQASMKDNTLTFVVEDTGCGIPAVEAEHIFDRFVKLDTFKMGIGLGLPLCRVAAQGLGGRVSLDTTYSSGARFVVELPIK